GRASSHFQWYENGQMESEEHYDEAGEPTGRRVAWYENGQMESETHYEAGEPTGRQILWYENGQMWFEQHYEAGEPTGRRMAWYENGQMWFEQHYEAGERTGRWVAWHENGQMESEAHYEAGERRGLRTEWDSDGNKEIEFDYDANSFTVGIGSGVAQLPLTSSGSLSADTQFVFETGPGCTRVEIGNTGRRRGSYFTATLSNVWTGERAARWQVTLSRRYSETIDEALSEHYILHLDVVGTPEYELEVAATDCDG
ncbi:MAG: toxin-antitoxin system YwqK family antitoxin, partial [Gemmatimonadetes bacterium]|nr:toxin-antitoxin system YwqK family antitoxin [Gemmatimonadota bacterium]